ncbi:MAG: hypothetical protein ABJA71_03680 [Ginsengibacter sp.]
MSTNLIITNTDFTSSIFKRLKKYRYLILGSAILLALLLAFYAKNSLVTYISKATIFSLSSGNDNTPATSALSILLGTESNKSFSDETSINIMELAQSRTTSEAVAAMPVPKKGNKLIAELLPDEINSHKGWMQSKVIPPKDKEQLIIWAGMVLRSGITATINKNSSFVLTYTGRSEEMVKIISYGFIDKISQFYIDLKREKAKRDFEFASEKVDSLRRVMGAKDYMLIGIDKRTLFTNTNKLQYKVPTENLLADKEMIRNQYASAVANQQSAAYKLQKDTPLIRVLDRPDPPFDKKSKSAIVYAIIGFLAGAVLIGGLVTSGLLFRYLRQEVSKAIFGNSPSKTTSTTASVL